MIIYNAAGPKSKDLVDIQALLRTSVPKITIGSVWLEKHLGNQPAVYWSDEHGNTLNSIGLKSEGLAYYEPLLPDLLKSTDKLIRVNIVEDTAADYATLADRLIKLGIKEIEINASCPNVWKDGEQKAIATYCPPLLQSIMDALQAVSREPVFDIKLSPLPDPEALREVATLIAGYSCVRAVVCCNTFPNAANGDGKLCGLGGSALHYIAVGQVQQFRSLLPTHITVVGVGGVSEPKHVENFRAAGAAEVQVGSHYFQNGSGVFGGL